MADIDIKQPAKINRNTAADGDFLWEKDFKVLYENDEKLKNAIQQATQDYTAGDGIDIDPSTKTISVKTGTGIEKTEEGLSVNIEGVDGAKIELNGNTYKVSAYNAEPDIEALNDNLEDLQNELDAFEQEVAEKYITSGNEMVPNHQYVYTTSGWADIGGEHATVSYWRPTYNESTGKLSWQMSPSIEAPDDALVKGDKGDDGKTPEFRINQSTNFWEWKYTDAQNWTSTNTSATGPQGSKGEQGNQGYTPEISTSIDTEHSGTKVTFSWPERSQLQPTEFTIPSGTPGAPGINGTNGTNGTDGITPKLRVDSSTNRWQVSYDNGSNWADISPATSATGPKGDRGPEPTIQARAITDPTGVHTEGGVEWTIKYPGMAVEAIGQIWNGNNGTATVNCEGTYITGNGTSQNPIQLTSIAQQQIEAVSGKLTGPDGTNIQKIYGYQADEAHTQDKWIDLSTKFIDNPKFYDKIANNILLPESGLSAEWDPYELGWRIGMATSGIDANKKYAFTKNGWDEIDDFVNKTGDSMTGNLSVVIDEAGNDSAHRAIIGAYDTTEDSQGTAFAIIGATRKKSNNYGTTWLGVASNGSGVLKNVPNATSAAPNASQSTQLTFGQDNNLPVLNLSVQNNSTSAYKVLATTEASYNGMALSGIDSNNMSGPNYMITKNAEGQLVIGAAVYNCQGSLPGTLTPNTYYFVY